MARWNLFSKIATLLGGLLMTCAAGAVNLHAFYTASCQREIGIVLDVTPRQVFLLNLNGEIVSVPRFEIIYFATYPLDIVPMEAVSNAATVPLVEIKTWQHGGLQSLVRGWPVDFSQDKISFLSLRGSELVIDRASIWEVTYDQAATSVHFTTRPSNAYEFVHPYAFASCPVGKTPGSRPIKVYPQQLLSDPVVIKRELDRLVAGHEGVKQYASDQQFYAVPEIYSNETSLGLWIQSPARYGASSNRKNSFTPLLINDFSSGPFGFQSHLRTGSGPLPFSIHEEAQTHTYYRMKADYFHFSAMVDPSLLLVGKRYKWFAADLNSTDVRANDSAFLEFGFDYGRWSLELGLGGATNLAARDGELFQRQTLSVPRFGLRYQRPTWTLHGFYGRGEEQKSQLHIYRANLDFNYGKDQRYVISIFNRDMSYNGLSTFETGSLPMDVKSDSQTVAAYGFYRFRSRYWCGLSLAAEHNVITTGTAGSHSHLYPKAGTYLSLSF